MLIPSIDLQGGRIVQLVHGEKLAIETGDVDGWIARFARYPKVQLIDLDAAKSEGQNDRLVREICSRLPCRVGGGIRSVERARAVLEMGATHVILSSALFRDGPEFDLDLVESTVLDGRTLKLVYVPHLHAGVPEGVGPQRRQT